MAVYWLGANGNIYVKGSSGVKNMGQAMMPGLLADSYIAAGGRGKATQIADPSAPPTKGADAVREAGGGGGSSSGGGGGGTAAAPAPVLNQAAIDNTSKAISSLDEETNVGNRNIDDSFNSLIGKYDKDAANNESDYQEQDVTNNQNLLKNKQNALSAAAQGRRGLRGTLASLGALSGDGGKIADRVVTKGANEDIGDAADAFATNSGTLTKAIDRFRDEDKDRRKEAETAKQNQKTALEGSIASKKQNFFQKMAELFAGGGRNDEATNWLNRAGDLNNTIASKTAIASTPFTEKAAAFTPGKLADYLAGAGDMTVQVASGDGASGQPSIIAARGKKKDEKQTQTA